MLQILSVLVLEFTHFLFHQSDPVVLRSLSLIFVVQFLFELFVLFLHLFILGVLFAGLLENVLHLLLDLLYVQFELLFYPDVLPYVRFQLNQQLLVALSLFI